MYLEDWLDEEGRLIPQWSVAPVETSMKQIADLHDRAGCVPSGCTTASPPVFPFSLGVTTIS